MSLRWDVRAGWVGVHEWGGNNMNGVWIVHKYIQ